MFELTEPIALVAYQAHEPTETVMANRFTNYWDAYFAGRAAPLGHTSADVVHALFYNFADGEVARHIPKVWDSITPDEAITLRQQGCAAAIRRIAGDLLDSPAVTGATELLLRAATSGRTEGRPMYAALTRLPIPGEPVERLWHAANLLREHRGDGHIAALMAEGINGTECHVLLALSMGMPAEKFGRVHHLPSPRLAAVIDGMRDRGLIGQDGWLTDAGKATKERVETLTDQLASPAYDVLTDAEIDDLTTGLQPVSASLAAVGSE
ncbi:hypothetical protein GCM10022234_32450 [Aeromicrobium panaciterrae]